MGVPEIFIWGATAQEVWGTEAPSEVKGRSPRKGSGGRLPAAEAVCRHCLQILSAETIKI